MRTFRQIAEDDASIVKVGQIWTENVPKWNKSITLTIEILEALGDNKFKVQSSDQNKISTITKDYILKNYTN